MTRAGKIEAKNWNMEEVNTRRNSYSRFGAGAAYFHTAVGKSGSSTLVLRDIGTMLQPDLTRRI
jgi:hypothetical protein